MHDLSHEKDVGCHRRRQRIEPKIFDGQQYQEWSIGQGRARLLTDGEVDASPLGRRRIPRRDKTGDGRDQNNGSGNEGHHAESIRFRHAEGVPCIRHQSGGERDPDKGAHRNPGHPEGHQF